MEISTGDKIKVFDNTDVELYLNYFDSLGYDAELDGDYIVIGEPHIKHDNTEYAKQILFFRKLRNMSREKLADKCGVTVQTVIKWEKGLAEPRDWQTIQKVLKM